MSGTDTPTLPPPVLHAAALLRRAGTHAESLKADLTAALKQLEAARDSLPEGERYKVAHLLTGARVRQLDASTGAARLPELAQQAEALAPELPLPGLDQEGGTHP